MDPDRATKAPPPQTLRPSAKQRKITIQDVPKEAPRRTVSSIRTDPIEDEMVLMKFLLASSVKKVPVQSPEKLPFMMKEEELARKLVPKLKAHRKTQASHPPAFGGCPLRLDDDER